MDTSQTVEVRIEFVLLRIHGLVSAPPARLSLLLAAARYFSLLLASLLSFMIALCSMCVVIRVREVVLDVEFDLDFELI